VDQRRRENPIALAIAQVVLWGFNKHYRLFREISAGAKDRFERGAWQEIQLAQRERIAFYDRRVSETALRLEKEFNSEELPERVWQEVKYHYINLLVDHKQPECAETFFNSVCCRILHRDYYRNDYIFVRPTISTEHLDSDPPAYRSYYPLHQGLQPVVRKMLEDFGFAIEFDDLGRDVDRIVARATAHYGETLKLEPNHQIQVLSSLFFRNKGAYAIGKIVNGNVEIPFALALLRSRAGGVFVDALLFDMQDLLALFSFSRAYFMVEMEVPATFVQFLRSMLPARPKFELYNMIGLQKHGKALFYRDFLHHLSHSSDQFTIAPGIHGLVMLVFTLPSFPFVFKVIKDVIAPPKEVDREGVKAKYLMVKQHDRVGRMADTLEYSDVAFPKNRFSDELIGELRRLVPSQLLEEDDRFVIRHLYIERRMTPLNLYLQSASESEACDALEEYGLAIKQLAAANIFPGDLLYKNFGVTRNRRVVFYDYDEIEYMTQCNFRKVPLPRNEEEEMASEPWYPVAKNDVFPEEWKTFLLGDPNIRATLLRAHPELFDADFWNGLKSRILSGHIVDVFPYARSKRFAHSDESQGIRASDDAEALDLQGD
jgi:isocitrate dehydrogenase kinase/phosphatase